MDVKQPDWIAHASETVRNSNPHIFGQKRRKTLSRVSVGSRNGKRGKMNKTESEFALMLEAQKRNGGILRYEYQGMILRWGVDEKTGDSMRYTPDFVVFSSPWITHDPDENVEVKRFRIKLIEVKGPHIHYRQQAVARFKGCRAYWPEFQFQCWQKQKSGWKQIY